MKQNCLCTVTRLCKEVNILDTFSTRFDIPLDVWYLETQTYVLHAFVIILKSVAGSFFFHTVASHH